MINFNQKFNTFRIDTKNSTYCISISKKGYIAHSYYGEKLGDDDVTYLTRQDEYYMSDGEIFREKHTLLDFLPQEMPTDGLGDFRESALSVCNKNGNNGIELKYKSYKITNGTKKLPELPSVFGTEENSQTLEIITEDKILGVEVVLIYTVFSD